MCQDATLVSARKKTECPLPPARKPNVAFPWSRHRKRRIPIAATAANAIGRPSPKRTASMPKLYEALAEAFLAEGVDTQFVLMGDGNMHWSTAFAKLPGVETVHVRHEHATVAAATAYNVATNKVAVASVTCGPGVTQLMTALPAAVRARLPMVVFAGESPINAKFYNQAID